MENRPKERHKMQKAKVYKNKRFLTLLCACLLKKIKHLTKLCKSYYHEFDIIGLKVMKTLH